MSAIWAVGALVAALALCTAWVWSTARRPDLAVVAIVVLACFSSHVLALLYRAGVDHDVVRGLIPAKDVLATLVLAVLLWRELRANGPPRWLLLPATLLVLVGVLGLVARGQGPSLSHVALSARDAFIPFLALVTGLLLRGSERVRAVRGLVLVVTVGAIYAIVEYILPVEFVRDVIGVGRYWSDVKEQSFHLSPKGTGLPGNFFTSDGARRLSGAFGDPLSAGYALATALLLTLLSRWTRNTWVLAPILAVALLLTFTRAGWLLVVCGLAPVVFSVVAHRSWRWRLASLGVAVAATGVLFTIPTFRTYFLTVVQGRDDSSRGHMKALVASLDHDYTWFGGGWGASGGAVGRGTESVLVTLSLQIGVVGLILYLAALSMVVWSARNRWVWQGLAGPFVGVLVGGVITMVISENLLTFNAGWILLLGVGLAPDRREPELPGIEGRSPGVAGRPATGPRRAEVD